MRQSVLKWGTDMDTKDRDNDLLEPKRTREEELRYRRRKAAYLKKEKTQKNP